MLPQIVVEIVPFPIPEHTTQEREALNLHFFSKFTAHIGTGKIPSIQYQFTMEYCEWEICTLS